MSRYAAWVCLASLAGCYHTSPAPDVPCSANGACPDGQVCDHALSPPRCTTGMSSGTVPDGPGAPTGDAPTTAPALVQQATASALGGSPLMVTLPSLPAAGDLLIVLAGAAQAPLTGVQGGGVADWKPAAQSPVNCNAEIWYGTSDGTSAAVGIVLTGNTNEIVGHVSQWHGLATAPLDAAKANSGAASPVAPGTITTQHANDLLVLAASEPLPVTWGQPIPDTWTALKIVSAGSCEQAAWYRFATQAGAYAPTVAETGPDRWAAALGAFVVAP